MQLQGPSTLPGLDLNNTETWQSKTFIWKRHQQRKNKNLSRANRLLCSLSDSILVNVPLPSRCWSLSGNAVHSGLPSICACPEESNVSVANHVKCLLYCSHFHFDTSVHFQNFVRSFYYSTSSVVLQWIYSLIKGKALWYKPTITMNDVSISPKLFSYGGPQG